MEPEEKQYLGQCHCGAVAFQVTGEPLFTQYCHCNKCREVASKSTSNNSKRGFSFTAAYLTPKFIITKGKDCLEPLRRNNADLYLCKHCHELIYGISIDPNLQSGIGINGDCFGFKGKLPTPFKAKQHVYYADRIIDIDDSLPKYIDMPKELGGSGELCT